MKGGSSCWTLPAGYLGSSFIGSLLVFAGFDTVASKVASIIVGVVMLLTIWWARRSWLTLLTVLFAVGSESYYMSRAKPLQANSGSTNTLVLFHQCSLRSGLSTMGVHFDSISCSSVQ